MRGKIVEKFSISLTAIVTDFNLFLNILWDYLKIYGLQMLINECSTYTLLGDIEYRSIS